MAKRIPPTESMVDLFFPFAGVDLSQGYSLQRPQTTPVGQNVRAFEAISQRQRGGQRPGLAKYIPSAIPGGPSLIQDLDVVVGVGYTDPAPTGGAYLIQTSASVATGTGTSLSVSLPGPATNGNAICVCVGSTNGSHPFPSSVTDGTNTYTRVDNSSVSNTASSIWLATSITGAPSSATVNWAGSGSSYFAYALEIFNLTGAVDTSSEPTGVGTTGVGTNFTTTHAPDFAVGVNVANQTITQTAGAWFVLTSGQLWVAIRPLPVIGSYGADIHWAFGASTFWAACLKSLKANS